MSEEILVMNNKVQQQQKSSKSVQIKKFLKEREKGLVHSCVCYLV